MRDRIALLRKRLERLLLWRVWERMPEVEFVDRSVALAGNAFVSFFPLVIVAAAFAPPHIRASILTTITARLGFRGDALTIAMSATIWMPGMVTDNEAQFGFFGVALSLVTWFSGAAICVLVGACAGPVLAEDTGWIGTFVRGGEPGTLTAGALTSLPPPTRELSLRDAFQSTEEA